MLSALRGLFQKVGFSATIPSGCAEFRSCFAPRAMQMGRPEWNKTGRRQPQPSCTASEQQAHRPCASTTITARYFQGTTSSNSTYLPYSPKRKDAKAWRTDFCAPVAIDISPVSAACVHPRADGDSTGHAAAPAALPRAVFPRFCTPGRPRPPRRPASRPSLPTLH